MKKILTIICAACAVILLTSSKPIRVACIGDSITYGVGTKDRESDSYPMVLSRLLGEGYDVRNFGISATTMLKAGNYPYWNQQAYADAKEFLPDIVTIMLGTNDSKPMNMEHFSDFEQNYREMIGELQALPSHPRIYLCIPPVVSEDKWGIRDSVEVNSVNPAIKNVAIRKWLDLIDCRTPFVGRPELSKDGVHPNNEGATVIAETIVKGMALRADTKPAKRVLFIGDSITDDDWGKKDAHPTAERSHYDMNHIYGHGYVMDCAAYYETKYPQKRYTFYNRGISGNKVTDLQARWDNDVFPVHPDVISCLVGINDTGDLTPETFDFEKWEQDYRSLIERTLAFDKDIKIVLCTPFVEKVGGMLLNGRYEGNKIIIDRECEIVRKLCKEYGLTIVESGALMNKLVATDKSGDSHHWTWDGIHPTMAGHKKMAELWIKSTAKIMK